MAFDENLAARIRGQLGKKKGLTEKKLFGGIGFLVNSRIYKRKLLAGEIVCVTVAR